MAEQQDDFQRTEQPTPKRLADARKKGDAPRSQEVITLAMLAAGVLGLWLASGPVSRSMMHAGAAFLDHPHEFAMDGAALTQLYAAIAMRIGIGLGGVAMLFVAAALIGNIAQASPVLTIEKMKPSWSKLSPVAGFKRIFGPSGLFNFAKGVGKLAIVGAVLVFALWPDRQLLAGLPYADERTVLALAQSAIMRLLAIAVLAMAVIAALDYAFQRAQWMKRLRMTKEEVKREMKESEGDPHVKGRQRQQREARARRRMMAAVKDATVLIMNPTHYAVALKYDAGAAEAPVCVAKGLDELALRLRARAEESQVPVVENPPLARALYAAVEIDAEIPLEHYEAVAKVIGFVIGRGRTTH
ncbi:MAG: flagellar biosynthesis protein FlhB [Parvularculaceae bacterium]